MSVIFKTTLIKHRHDKEKFDADHFCGGYHYHYHYHHHHYHHHHHHHKHHYCYKVQKPLLSICLSSELSLSIIYYFQVILFVIIFVTILLSFVVVLCGTCFILFYFFFLGGGEGVVGVAHKFGIFVRTVLWPLAPLSGD